MTPVAPNLRPPAHGVPPRAVSRRRSIARVSLPSSLEPSSLTRGQGGTFVIYRAPKLVRKRQRKAREEGRVCACTCVCVCGEVKASGVPLAPMSLPTPSLQVRVVRHLLTRFGMKFVFGHMCQRCAGISTLDRRLNDATPPSSPPPPHAPPRGNLSFSLLSSNYSRQ
jgi:hypothetical protein